MLYSFIQIHHNFPKGFFVVRKICFIMCVTLFAVLLPGCEVNSQEDDYPEDSWYHIAMPSVEPWDWNKVNASEIYEVNGAAKSKAEHLLRQKSIIQLSPLQVDALLSQNLTSANLSGKTPYLVRALYFDKETGGFEVYFKGKTIWIEHGSLGHAPVPMKRQPLILLLKVRPDKVFVTCSMAE